MSSITTKKTRNTLIKVMWRALVLALLCENASADNLKMQFNLFLDTQSENSISRSPSWCDFNRGFNRVLNMELSNIYSPNKTWGDYKYKNLWLLFLLFDYRNISRNFEKFHQFPFFDSLGSKSYNIPPRSKSTGGNSDSCFESQQFFWGLDNPTENTPLSQLVYNQQNTENIDQAQVTYIPEITIDGNIISIFDSGIPLQTINLNYMYRYTSPLQFIVPNVFTDDVLKILSHTANQELLLLLDCDDVLITPYAEVCHRPNIMSIVKNSYFKDMSFTDYFSKLFAAVPNSCVSLKLRQFISDILKSEMCADVLVITSVPFSFRETRENKLRESGFEFLVSNSIQNPIVFDNLTDKNGVHPVLCGRIIFCANCPKGEVLQELFLHPEWSNFNPDSISNIAIVDDNESNVIDLGYKVGDIGKRFFGMQYSEVQNNLSKRGSHLFDLPALLYQIYKAVCFGKWTEDQDLLDMQNNHFNFGIPKPNSKSFNLPRRAS